MIKSIETILSLGSNVGNRKRNLEAGIRKLCAAGFIAEQISPIVETPAQLPTGSPAQWNKPYLNLVASGYSTLGKDEFYELTKICQSDLESYSRQSYEPRIIDIDILSWGTTPTEINGKSIPDPIVYQKPYVLSPLVHMSPGVKLIGGAHESAFELSCSAKAPFHIPLWMGIVNVTPDSFSDGNRNLNLENLERQIESMIGYGVNIIDVGAESTRPGATALSDEQEWRRLQPALEMIGSIMKGYELKPQISVDTYHARTAERCLEYDVDMINDVCGLADPDMIELAKSCDKTFVAMHSVAIPVNPEHKLNSFDNSCDVVSKWIQNSQINWDAHGIEFDRIIIDPGVGFGKNSLQNLHLMRSIKELRAHGHRVMIGHSRKSFLKSFANFDSSSLDTETIGASLQMCSQSVDILRVHDVEAHTRAYLSWAHVMDNSD